MFGSSRSKNTIPLLLLLTALWPAVSGAQELTFSKPHGFYTQPFTLQISAVETLPALPEGATIHYTLDSSEPTSKSAVYTNPITISGNTIIRAAAIDQSGNVTPIATATYLFIDDVLSQGNSPEGYPQQWGKYTEISGTATADYEMDPEMTSNSTLRKKIADGLQSLPVISIVTDKDNLFSHENDSIRGGIYIFTGPPVGDNTGHGWTRPASVEMFEKGEGRDFSVNCGLRLHGGHGRLAEKNPKHSFRLVFKEKYGPKSLKYPLYGEDEPSKFDQLVLRCHFGNSWQHWGEGNRKKAQYTRDVWARRIQRRMGGTSVNALYVNLFLNGMYWGLYNVSERVDDQFGKSHLGGEKSDIEVVKIEEDGGNHIEAAEGDLVAWEKMLETVKAVSEASPTDNTYYEQLDTLLDIGQFIDYMLINQYAVNTDWDHHNWYAVRRKGEDSQGFRFLCWDSEVILENEKENLSAGSSKKGVPTTIYRSLLHNDTFARRYVRRAKEVLSENGVLGQQSVVEVWDSLYNNIQSAIYAEAARWGDYRRDVHRYSSKGELYTVDNHYMNERNRLLTEYFPVRTDNVLNYLLGYINIDDFEMPDDWTPLMASMFHQWNGTGADAQPLDNEVSVDWNMGVSANNGTAIAGFGNVEYNRYADISAYDKLVIRGSGTSLRILANRLVDHGSLKEIAVSFNDSDPYWDSSLQAIVLPLDDIKTVNTNKGETRKDSFVHLHTLKVNWNNTVNVKGAYLVGGNTSNMASLFTEGTPAGKPDVYYNLNGQVVEHPGKGIFIKNGKKIVIK